mgnify:FL=1
MNDFGNTNVTHTTALSESLRDSEAQPSNERLLQLCHGFESVFFGQLLRTMRRAMVVEGSLFGHSVQEDIYRGMIENEVAKNAGKAAGLGIAKLLMKQLTATVGTEPAEAPTLGS